MTRHRVTRHVFGSDFETDNDGVTAWVVQWAISDGTKEWYGPDLDSWMKATSDILKRYRNAIFYFHNLRFDLSFIRSQLVQMRDEYGFEMTVLMRKGNPIQIRLENNHHSLTLRDSAKKIPGDLRHLGHLIGLEK